MTVCLTMIVKDEAHVIARAIESVRHLVDCYAIVDTGSTDDTRDVALRALCDLPGWYENGTWEGYGPSRCKSLVLAELATKARDTSYALIVDADDVWSGPRPTLTEDAHAVWFERPGARWATTRYLRLGCGMRYEGVVHEQPVAANGKPPPAPLLEGLTVTSPSDGATSRDPDKYLHHAKALAAAMVDDPANTRSAFYLAQSYRDHGDDERAASLYLARAGMGGNVEEVYVAYLNAGRALWRLGRMDEAKSALLKAHLAYPARLEAMAELARWFAVKAATSPPAGTLFVETGGGEVIAPDS